MAETFGIKTLKIDLTRSFDILNEEIFKIIKISNKNAYNNIKPRLRMVVLYTVAQCNNYLVAGTGNRSEAESGYFTKWGDGAYDFDPIADLTVREVRLLGTYLGVPKNILNKPPSVGLFYGQKDEDEIGLKYEEIDDYLLKGKAKTQEIKDKIDNMRNKTEHKRKMPLTYKKNE